jgi:hypothetical protein
METRIRNGTVNTSTTESVRKANETKLKNGANRRTKESIDKGIRTKKDRGNHIRSPESYKQGVETRKANGLFEWSSEMEEKRANTLFANKSGIYDLTKCPHCNKTVGKPMYIRWHGDKCKHK